MIEPYEIADADLQAAIFAALDAALSVPVLDHYDGETLPVVVLGDMTDVPWTTKRLRGQRITARIRAVSDARGMKEVQGLKAEIVRTLSDNRFALPNHTVKHARYVQGPLSRYPDPETGRTIRQANIEIEYWVT